MIEKFVDFQIKYAKVLFLLILVIIGIGAYIGSNLQIDPSFSVLVPKESEYNTNDRILENAFEQNDGLIILIKPDPTTVISNAVIDLEDSRVTSYVNDLRETLELSPHVLEVNEPVISNDKRNIQLTVSLNVPDKVGGFNEVFEELNILLEEVGSPPGIQTNVGGFPVLLDRVSTLLIEDSLKTVLITLVFVFLVLLWYTKDIYFSLITLATPAVSLILLAAAMVLLGINVTITLAAVGVLVLGLGADYSIHIATHYRSARREFDNHRDALIHTVDSLFIPITASFITTLAGFTALIFGVSPSSQAQGVVLNLGIIMIYFATLIQFPILLTVFADKISVKSNPTFRRVISLLTKLAVYQTHHAKTVITIIALITVVMFYGASQVEFSTSNSNWIPDGDPVSEIFRENIYVFGNVDSLSLILTSTKGDLRDVQTARDVNRLVAQLEGIPNIETIINPYEGIEYSTSEVIDVITNTPEIRSQFNNDYTLTRITIISENFDVDEAGDSPVLAEAREIVKLNSIHNADVSFHGDPVRFEELGDSLEQDAGVTTILGLGLVFFVASAIYASIVIGFLALLPIVIAVLWAVGLMGFFSVPFTSLSTGIISLVLGIGVDFSIHLVDSIKKHLRVMDIEEAITKSLSTSGAAILLSSFTTFVGFMALTLATLLGTQRLGWSLAFSILAVFVVAIVLVPAMLSLTNKKKNV